MGLIELIKKHQNEILDNGILIEYSLFFDEFVRKHCVFAIDEIEELDMLNSVFLNLKEKDRDAEIYINTYGINFAKDNIYIYADTVWINSILNVEEIYIIFKDYPIIEPSDIALVVDDEIIDEIVALVVSKEYRIEDMYFKIMRSIPLFFELEKNPENVLLIKSLLKG